MKKIVNGICVALAFVCVGLGVIGIVLPILPTTPLFIAAACLFAKGSEKFHAWFLSTKLYKKYIESAVKNGTMEKKAKRNMMITLGIKFNKTITKLEKTVLNTQKTYYSIVQNVKNNTQ